MPSVLLAPAALGAPLARNLGEGEIPGGKLEVPVPPAHPLPVSEALKEDAPLPILHIHCPPRAELHSDVHPDLDVPLGAGTSALTIPGRTTPTGTDGPDKVTVDDFLSIPPVQPLLVEQDFEPISPPLDELPYPAPNPVPLDSASAAALAVSAPGVDILAAAATLSGVTVPVVPASLSKLPQYFQCVIICLCCWHHDAF